MKHLKTPALCVALLAVAVVAPAAGGRAIAPSTQPVYESAEAIQDETINLAVTGMT